MCVTLTTGTQLTLGSVFITVIVFGSWSPSSVISKTFSASIPIASFPSTVDVAHVLLQEPTSPFSKSMLFCKTTTNHSCALLWHESGIYQKHFSQHQNDNATLQIYFAEMFKVIEISPPPNTPVIVPPLATHLPTCYTTWRHITLFRGAYHTFLSVP